MTTRKLKADDVIADVDYILVIVLKDNNLKFVGQGLKWRANPLHPHGWKKLSTAQGYAKQIEQWPDRFWMGKVVEIRVCERVSDFRCLSSYAISKQETVVAKEQSRDQ